MSNLTKAQEDIKIAWRIILTALKDGYGLDVDDPNFYQTPGRIAKSLTEKCRGIRSEELCREILQSSFPSPYQGMIVFEPIIAHSLCPHHFETVEYEVNVGYIPTEKCVGLSKIVRAVKLYAAQPILQETFTNNIATMINDNLNPEGVGVITKARHHCMISRGVNEPRLQVRMASVVGTFLSDPSVKDEFYKLIDH